MKIQKDGVQSVFDKKIQLDEETKKKFRGFAKEMEELKNKSVEESELSRTVVCGPKEFGETGDKKKN